jgi:exonuclease III/ribonuclease HI
MASHAPSNPSLRLGTFNVGQGLVRKLPDLLTHCTALSLDIIALQEVGDPALLYSTLLHYSLSLAAGPSPHQGGVGILLSRTLTPFCRAHRRSKSGRLHAVVLELSKGQRTLIASVYMPTALDQRRDPHPDVQLSHQLYTELALWSTHVQQVIILGDLNETLTRLDRLPRPSSFRKPLSAPIYSLVSDGFTDVYRSVYPDAHRHPGFTHEIVSDRRHTCSRIDYIWTRGLPLASIAQCSVHRSPLLHRLSHHHLLLVTVRLSHAAPSHAAMHAVAPPPRLPNLRVASEEQLQVFTTHLDTQLPPLLHDLPLLSAGADAASLSLFASSLSSVVRTAAFCKLPLSRASTYKSKDGLQLQRTRRDLNRLVRTACTLVARGETMTRSPEWLRLQHKCALTHRVQWTVDPSTHEQLWIDETQQLIRDTRAALQKEMRCMKKIKADRFDGNSTAMVQQLLQGLDDRQLFSVLNKRGDLVTDPEEVKEVMVDYFQEVFSLPPPDPTPLPHPPPPMLFSKPNIDPSWYAGLMADVGAAEILDACADASLTSAPGEDLVSTGVWKCALQSDHVKKAVSTLFTSCIRTSSFPSSWKGSVILPLVKDAAKERAMANVRPISLQNCLGKLFSKVLAMRLGRILAQFPILNSSQRGFIPGGTSSKCIDELLDAWSWSRSRTDRQSKEMYSLFYDIKQAYDSVQTDVLVRAFRRLHLPPAFTALIEDSLTGLTSCVRTLYGPSRSFALKRSVRQGDPLAPILFVILMDALHDGLQENPFTGQKHGCVLSWPGQEVYLPSLGYADDTTALATSLPDLRVQHEWVLYFMVFNKLRLNSLKCEVVGCDDAGSPVTPQALKSHEIKVDGHYLQPVPHDQPIRYLGAHSCFNGSWAAQQNKSKDMIMLFTRAVQKFRIPVAQAVRMFNVFLLPRLELALHYVHGPHTSRWIHTCDQLLVGCIKHAASSPLKLSHSAVALTTGLLLPSWQEVSVKVSELFLRMNSSDPRWGLLGRTRMRNECKSTVNEHSQLPLADNGTLLQRTVRLAVQVLNCELFLNEQFRPGSRRRHVFDSPAAALMPNNASYSSYLPVDFPASPGSVVHDNWTGWGKSIPPQEVHVYTDGSHQSHPQPSSSWAVTVGNKWLRENFDSIPADENILRREDFIGAQVFASSIENSITAGIYPAELQAVARALAMLPLSFNVHLHTDSQSSIAGIKRFGEEINERKKFRMQCRTLLLAIQHLLTLRKAAGGSASFHHVRSHTDNTDIASVGNRLADFRAEESRRKSEKKFPLNLQEIPLHLFEPHLRMKKKDGLQIIDDVRSFGKQQRKTRAFENWSTKPDQGMFASPGMKDLGATIMKFGSAHQQNTLLHLATNSIHKYWKESGAGEQSLGDVQCSACAEPLSILHLSDCLGAQAVSFHHSLQQRLLQLLRDSHCDPNWLRANHRLDLPSLTRKLFPPPAGAADAEAIRLHTARCMLGAFSTSEANAAAKALQLPLSNARPTAMELLRCCCVDQFSLFYASSKS